MENNIKRCKQCGEFRSLNMFREYYNRKGSRYKTCKVCEKINTRYKYLNKKLDKNALSEAESQEKEKIEELYEVLRDQGLRPPESKQDEAGVMSDVESLLQSKHKRMEEIKAVDPSVSVAAPQELLDWLDADLSKYEPNYLQGVIADELISKYKPQIGLDEEYKPVYDETHRELLNKVLARFDDYEDSYY